jgi:hypothetical protein
MLAAYDGGVAPGSQLVELGMTLIGQLLRKAHPQLPDSDGPAVRAQLDGIAQLCRDRLRQQEHPTSRRCPVCPVAP